MCLKNRTQHWVPLLRTPCSLETASLTNLERYQLGCLARAPEISSIPLGLGLQTHNTMPKALKNVGLGDPTRPHSCTVETSLPWLSPQQSSLIFLQLEMGSYNSDPYFSDLGLIQEFGVPRVKWVVGCWNGVHRMCIELIVSSGSCGNPRACISGSSQDSPVDKAMYASSRKTVDSVYFPICLKGILNFHRPQM